jgi:hypothetical protein
MVVQSLRLATKDAALADYCIERDIVDAQLKQGIIAASISDGVPNALQSILLFILLFVALLYLVRGRIF